MSTCRRLGSGNANFRGLAGVMARLASSFEGERLAAVRSHASSSNGSASRGSEVADAVLVLSAAKARPPSEMTNLANMRRERAAELRKEAARGR